MPSNGFTASQLSLPQRTALFNFSIFSFTYFLYCIYYIILYYYIKKYIRIANALRAPRVSTLVPFINCCYTRAHPLMLTG